MSQQPIFFEKNKLDIDQGTNVTCTITDATATDTGSSFVDYMRNRNNRSGWGTVGSNDAANTEQLWELSDEVSIDTLILIGHNFGSYTIQYWNGSTYVDFSTAVSVSGNTQDTTFHYFDAVTTTKIKIIITGTIDADTDKVMKQFIATEKIGQLGSGFKIVNPRSGQERRQIRLLSGRSKITRNIGAFSVRLEKNNVVDQGDVLLFERCLNEVSGFLVWLCGGERQQFRVDAMGYRLEDIYLMDMKNEWEPEFDNGGYQRGLNLKIELVEVI